ncbi:MAG: class I tRNA ligase family protein [bacterium]|nr:class I tRNA ligase family protein [bacterium]
MEKNYNHKEVEARICRTWEKGNYFTPQVDSTKKPFSIFLVPPNASGGMHVGNVLMIAIQDILARYHRAKGDSTLWIPGTDHGGYETQVTFERELEKVGKNKSDYSREGLFEEIKHFVERNNELIKTQIKAVGASVDWTRFRFTMDDDSLQAVEKTFRKMVSDNLIYRRSYMVNYCSSCGTILADIELKEDKERMPLYFIKFNFENSEEYLTLATTRPEFLFAVTHVLIHPSDERYANHIGRILKNPITGHPVEIIASKRKFDPLQRDPFLSPFSPSYIKYDYEYTLRTSLPSRNLLDWEGNMLERCPGMKPTEARGKEVLFLQEHGFIEKIDNSYTDSVFLCKRGHIVESVIMLTWFLKLDDEKNPLRKPAVEAVKGGGLAVFPKWREKGLIGWLEKMFDWPIARQNVWGIKIPVWYDVSDPSKFMVWFSDKTRMRHCGNLKHFLDQGVSLEELSQGLERIYASEGAVWVLEKEQGKSYLPETDTFDTWFSSGQWGTIVFGNLDSEDFSYFYPSASIVIGHDLLRLSVSRKILLSHYLTGKLPFKTVYLHRLLKGSDGQKMSKSLGNAVSLESYLEKFGADVTRMSLISYTTLQEDFIFDEERLIFFQEFSHKLWHMGQVISLVNQYSSVLSESLQFSSDDKKIRQDFDKLTASVGFNIERYSFAYAQEKLCQFLSELEKYAQDVQAKTNIEVSLSVLRDVYAGYLTLLHPFMPFMTEELYLNLYNSTSPLAVSPWSSSKRV